MKFKPFKVVYLGYEGDPDDCYTHDPNYFTEGCVYRVTDHDSSDDSYCLIDDDGDESWSNDLYAYFTRVRIIINRPEDVA